MFSSLLTPPENLNYFNQKKMHKICCHILHTYYITGFSIMSNTYNVCFVMPFRHNILSLFIKE